MESIPTNSLKTGAPISRGITLACVDYLICILTEDIEPDFMHLDICSGLGFKDRHLCRVEQEGKNIADSIPFDKAEALVEDLGNNEVCLLFLTLDHLFTVFEAEGLFFLQ